MMTLKEYLVLLANAKSWDEYRAVWRDILEMPNETRFEKIPDFAFPNYDYAKAQAAWPKGRSGWVTLG